MCDFDQTLTCYYVNGKPGCTSHGKCLIISYNDIYDAYIGVIEDALLMPESFRQKVQQIY